MIIAHSFNKWNKVLNFLLREWVNEPWPYKDSDDFPLIHGHYYGGEWEGNGLELQVNSRWAEECQKISLSSIKLACVLKGVFECCRTITGQVGTVYMRD